MVGMLSSLLALALLSASATVANSQALVVFGDSLSDNGYGTEYIGHLLGTTEAYPAAPYYEGRWSNGPVWAEAVVEILAVPLHDYAIGGASTGATPPNSSPIFPPFANLSQPFPYQAPSVQEQVGFFLADNSNVSDPTAVYVIAAGANDIFESLTVNVTAEDMADFVGEAIQKLYDTGARNFVIVPPPNPAITAGLAVTPYAPGVTALSLEYLVALTDVAIAVPAELNDTSVAVFDFGNAFLEVLVNSTGLGITNTTQCYIPSTVTFEGVTFNNQGSSNGTLCSDPNSHSSWDGVHPTETVHAAIGKLFVRDVGPVFWGVQPASM